jgi:hypothetical protein
LNAKNESPLDMAVRLNKQDMCTILRPKTVARPSFVHKQQSADAPSPTLSTPSNEQSKNQQSASQAIRVMTKSNLIGFEGFALDMNQSGNFTVGPNTLYNSACIPPPPTQPPKQNPPPPPKTSGFQHVITRKTIVSEIPLASSDPPAPPPAPATSLSAAEQLMKNFTCPLTKKIFVDPVIASDGQTYERSAILRWIDQNHNSPITGAAMDASIRDNKEIKGIIQLIQNQN